MKADIPESVIVKLIDSEMPDSSFDFELPTKMPAKDLAKGILRLLKVYGSAEEWNNESRYANKVSLSLFYDEVKLQNSQTLASVGAWDGSTIRFKAY